MVGPGRSLSVTSPRTCDRAREPRPTTLPIHLDPDDADQARKILKEPYVVDSVGLDKHASEGELGDALIARLQGTLREFGCAFVGRQVEVDGDEFFMTVPILGLLRSSRNPASGDVVWDRSSEYFVGDDWVRPHCPVFQ